MSQTIIISDTLYAKLDAARRERGFSNIEQLLENLHEDINESHRQQIARRIEELSQRLSQRYGIMPDSVDLIREDRER